MAETKTLLIEVLEQIRDGAAVLDADHTITQTNTVLAKLFPVNANMVGVSLDAVFPILERHSKTALGSWDVTPTKQWVIDRQLLFPNGDTIPIGYKIAELASAGQPVTVVFIRDLRHELELMELRSEFVSIVSHQLRTPASTVKWYLESLIDNRRGNELNEWQQDKLHQAYQSNERMISLINDLLNVSRLDSGKYVLKSKAIALPTLLQEVVDELFHFARAHNVDLNVQTAASLPAVTADVDKVREVILNLVNNAIKYSRPGHCVVTIAAKVQDQFVECTVQDQGIGIPEKSLGHIFEKFYRADNAVESQTEGSGLGLYIAREIIRLHGGDIWLTSQVGQGTTVHFTLPINP